ncbi:MAG: glycosyltransferase family 2 protein [Saprospiraceae bacterium]|nr:glycosyltransferase family 2 protein [Saprospiraceae bacterium]MBP7679983.1 glycosyltransferase family 2 protein [Saprospiraceae bacterium]
MQLSVVIITYNEARNITRCITSLIDVADEVVVVDSYSTDATVSIAEGLGARVVQHPFAGHIEQKNWALQQAKYPHVLSLDADEALDETLRQAIIAVKKKCTHDAYTMNRLTNFCGVWVHHSGWYPDVKLRLWDKRKGQWGGMNPHDKVILNVAGATQQHLRGDLLHYSYYTQTEHIERAKKYADIAAKAYFERGKKATVGHLLFSPTIKFIRNYIFRLGFLDGRTGWTICSVAAKETFWKYRQLLALQRSGN